MNEPSHDPPRKFAVTADDRRRRARRRDAKKRIVTMTVGGTPKAVPMHGARFRVVEAGPEKVRVLFDAPGPEDAPDNPGPPGDGEES